MADPDFTFVKDAELLGLWTATVDGCPKLVLSLRLDANSFQVTNLCLSADQAKRLAVDLSQRFSQSELLRDHCDADPELRTAFDRIISEQTFEPKVEPENEQ